METEGHKLLDDFGKLFAAQFDSTLEQVRTNLEKTRAPCHRKDVALRQYLESASEDQRALKVACYALQKFAHSLFAALDGSDVYALVGKGTRGELFDLKKYSDLFPEETNQWCDRHSRYGSLTNDLLAIMDQLQ